VKRLVVLALLFLAQAPRTVSADAVCYQGAVPAPTPATGQVTLPVCVNGVLQAGVGGTPVPQPTQPYSVNVLNTPTVNAGTGFPTPLAVQPVSGTVTTNQGTSPWVVNTPPPFSGTVTQGTSPWIVNTPAPFSGVVTQGTSPWVVNTPVPYPTAAVGSYLLVSPTALPTLSVTVTNVSSFPTPLAVQPVSGTVTANQGGTWTVQPGNTANTTAWKVDGSAVTQPISGTITANQGTNPWTVGTHAVTQGTSPWVVNTPVPYPTNGSGVLKVDGSAVTQPVSGTFFQATQPVSCSAGTTCPVNATLQAGTAIAGKVGIDQTTPGVTNAVWINNTVTVGTHAVTQGTSPWIISGSGTAGAPASGIVTVQGILQGQGLIVQIGGSTKTILTSSSPTACTSIEASTNGMLAEIINTGAAQLVAIQMYDEGVSPTCSNADLIYGNGSTLVLGAGQIITFGIPITSGIAYKLSGALGANVVITRNG
jgi:hypothetical protein